MRWAPVRAALLGAVLTGALTCCSSSAGRPAGTAPGLASSPATLAPAQVQQDVRRAVDRFNSAAGGPVAGQQAALAALVDAGQRSVQRRCSPATTTLRFEPVYGRLAPAPGWAPSQGTLAGAVYALPTLIRIYTGNRITGTDLTDLHIAVQDGEARLPALCLG